MARLRARQAYALLALAVPLIGPSLWCKLPCVQEAWLQPLGTSSTLRPLAGHLRSSQGKRLILRAVDSDSEPEEEEDEEAVEEVAEEEEERADEDPILAELRALSEEKNLSEVEEVFPRYLDRLRTYEDRNEAWDLLLRACVKDRNNKHAEGWYKEMGGFVPRAKTFGKLMHAAGKDGNLAAMSSWYRSYKKHYQPEDVVFNILLRACASKGKPDEAKKWLGEMVNCGIAHSRVSYHAMMEAHAALADPRGAKVWMNLMESDGIEPEFKQHLTYLKAMMKSRNYEQTEKLFNEVVQYEVENDKEAEMAYHMMIQACSFGARIEEAEMWFQKMVDAGITPGLHSYNAMMRVYGKAKDIKGAQRWMDKMKEAGIQPQATNYRTLLHNYAAAGNLLSAKEIVLSMKKMGFPVTRNEYRNLIEGAAKRGLLETAADHFRAMVQDGIEPTVMEYTSLMKACARSDPKRVDAAEIIFTRMVQVDIKPLPQTLVQLIKAIGGPNTKDLRHRLGVEKDSAIDWLTDDHSGRVGDRNKARARRFGQSFGGRSKGNADQKVRQTEDA